MTSEQIYEYIKDYANRPIDDIYLWSDEDDEAYEKIINHLLSFDNAEINDWLWNALKVQEDEYDIESSSLTEKGKEYVSNFVAAKRNWLNKSARIYRNNLYKNILVNINEDIEGERIILKPCSIKDNCDLYLHHVEFDGDFLTYATPNSKNDSPSVLCVNTCLPFAFYIFLKDTNEEIGIASLYDFEYKHNRVLQIAKAHYYIYKEYRHKGYAYEAMSFLVDAFFNRKLKNYVAIDKKYLMEEKYCEPLCIKICANAKNQASNALADKLGFVFEGTNHYHQMMDDIPQDENNYYLDKEIYSKNN